MDLIKPLTIVRCPPSVVLLFGGIMSLQGEKTKALYQRAERTIPYGVNSNFRYWGDDDTLVITRAQGAYIWDADGKRYIDYRLGFGPIILGHAYPPVVERVRKPLARAASSPGPRPWKSTWPNASLACATWTWCGSRTPAPRPPCTPCGWPAPTLAASASSSSRATITACTTMPCTARPRRMT